MIPASWRPSYLALFRMSNTPFFAACNYHLPYYLKSYDKITNHAIPCPKRLRSLLFGPRQVYITTFAPFVAAAENAFTQQLLETGEAVIRGNDVYWRQWLYDLPSIGTLQPTQGQLHIWARPFHVSEDRWGMPCFRCEFLHKAMWNWDIGGRKCVSWRREFSAMNCAEPCALAMAYRSKNEGQAY